MALLPFATKFAKVMFLHLSVSHSVLRGWGGISTHPRTKGRHFPRTKGRHPPGDGYCCGRYASYWNAFLLLLSIYSYIPSIVEVAVREFDPNSFCQKSRNLAIEGEIFLIGRDVLLMSCFEYWDKDTCYQ